jgi:hypothetical protein
MGKDPAFLFYPGDYLRDTQCLSEQSQVAYDRIMCEHMRNICISESRLNFFTKRLSEDQKSELMSVMSVVEGGFCIQWVAESVEKRIAYNDSRRKNRVKSCDNHMNNICESHDQHMENENENVIINKSDLKEGMQGEREKTFDEFRKKYPGTKRGNKTEYENFCKKHRDHNTVLPLLLPALDNQSAWRLEMSGAGQFVPEWKNLQTWINQRCWEMEKPMIEFKKPKHETQDEMFDRLEREGKIPRSPQ